MRKLSLSLLLITLFGFVLNGQNTKLEVFIQATSTETDTLADGTIITLNFSTDDVEEENGAVVKLYDDDLDIGWEGAATDQNLLTLGFRFRDITVPQGATIDSAFITVHAHEGKGAVDVCILNLTGEATDNAVTFDWTPPVSERVRTSASVKWTVAEDWIIWKPYNSPDLGAIVQEIVNRAGWTAGNSIAMILEGEDQGVTIVENAREFMSFENIQDPSDVDPDGVQGDGKNHPDKVPKLTVYYSSGETSVQGINGQQKLFHVYPNPGTGVLNVSLKSEGPARIQIFNLRGQMLRSCELTTKTTRLNVSNMKAGMYVFKVVQQNGMQVRKVIIK